MSVLYTIVKLYNNNNVFVGNIVDNIAVLSVYIVKEVDIKVLSMEVKLFVPIYNVVIPDELNAVFPIV